MPVLSTMSIENGIVGHDSTMHQKLVAIRGVIIPAGWDERGNITDVAISARDEIEYRIEPASKGRELMDLLNKEIEASGTVAEGEGGASIVILDYNLLGKLGKQ